LRLPLFLPALLGALLIVGACAAAASPSPSASPNPTATDPPPANRSPETGGIEYPTGADEVVLRYEEGGGLMMVEWSLATAPVFTLYGDGTVIFRDPTAVVPEDPGGAILSPPFRTARLDPRQIEALLEFAVTEGGLATARERYENPMLADVGNAVFTINAGGRSKQVTVTGLFESDASAPDQLSRSQFLALAERLRDFDKSGGVPTAEYEPEAWRVHIVEAAGIEPGAVRPWPWDDVTPDDFAGEGSFPSTVISAEQLARLDVADASGGLMGYFVKAPDGKLYNLVVRPLLPDEES
jgi:hypothetical protein